MYMMGLIAQHNILLQLTPTDLCHRAFYKDIFTTHEQNMNPARPQAYSYILKHREQLLLVCDSETAASLVDHMAWTLQPKALKATTHSLVQQIELIQHDSSPCHSAMTEEEHMQRLRNDW